VQQSFYGCANRSAIHCSNQLILSSCRRSSRKIKYRLQHRFGPKRFGRSHRFASVALRVPSIVVDGEFNYLLNPLHPDFAQLKIGEPRRFSFDPRLSTLPQPL
jgi:RES domain-containing protein